MIKRIILASKSKYRAALLQRLGVSFESIDPSIDEDQIKNSNLSPIKIAEALAVRKAEVVFANNPDACVIGGDQLLNLDGKILGKPGSKEKAVEQLELLSGRSHELITSIAVLADGVKEIYTDVTRLTMRSLSREQLERYVDHDNPIYCAGSYMLEEQGISLFSSIESEDQTAIIGIPLMALTDILTGVGYSIP